MSVERKWSYDRIAASGEAGGRPCLFCGELIRDESQAGHWVLKAVEDKEDTDFVVADGFTHHECTERKLAEMRRGSFEIPDAPDLPSH